MKVHKTFRRRPGRLLNVLYRSNLRPVSTGDCLNLTEQLNVYHFIAISWTQKVNRTYLERLLNVSCSFSLRAVSRGYQKPKVIFKTTKLIPQNKNPSLKTVFHNFLRK